MDLGLVFVSIEIALSGLAMPSAARSSPFIAPFLFFSILRLEGCLHRRASRSACVVASDKLVSTDSIVIVIVDL